MINKPASRKFKRAELTVTYQPRRCTHVGECLRRAPRVFDTWQEPWVRVENGTAQEIIAAIERCPTGALHYEAPDGSLLEVPQAINTIVVARNGPYYVRGDLEIVMPAARSCSRRGHPCAAVARPRTDPFAITPIARCALPIRECMRQSKMRTARRLRQAN